LNIIVLAIVVVNSSVSHFVLAFQLMELQGKKGG